MLYCGRADVKDVQAVLNFSLTLWFLSFHSHVFFLFALSTQALSVLIVNQGIAQGHHRSSKATVNEFYQVLNSFEFRKVFVVYLYLVAWLRHSHVSCEESLSTHDMFEERHIVSSRLKFSQLFESQPRLINCSNDYRLSLLLNFLIPTTPPPAGSAKF